MLSEATKGLKRTALYLGIGLMMVSAPALAGERPGVVTAASVNLRESATTDSASLHVLQKNTTLTVLGQEGDFYYVLDNGTYGYVAAQYVSLTEVTNHTGIVNVKSVNMRKGAGYDYTIVKVLHEGDKVAVNGETGDFYFVSLASGVTGYVHKDYLNITARTVKDDPLPEEVGLYGYVTAKTVNLRSSSSLTASIIQKLKQDSEVYVIARYNDFYYVQYRDTYGYIYADYITYQVPDGIADDTLHPESVAVNWTGKVNTDGLNVRSGPSKSSTKLASLSKGDRVTIVETSGDFYKVKYAAGKTGYVMAVYVDVVSKSSAGTVPTDNYANATTVASLGDAPGYLQLGDSGSDVKNCSKH